MVNQIYQHCSIQSRIENTDEQLERKEELSVVVKEELLSIENNESANELNGTMASSEKAFSEHTCEPHSAVTPEDTKELSTGISTS